MTTIANLLLVGLATAAPLDDEAYREELVAWLTAGPEGVDLAVAEAEAEEMIAFEARLPWQTGLVPIAGVAALELPDGDRFVGTEATAVILEAWGNPAERHHAGMVFPQGARVFGPASWGVVVDYEAIGWVDDADGASLDPDTLLETLQQANARGNARRDAYGAAALELTGWARPPRYDARRKAVTWARALRPADGEPVVNYEVRVLGRFGVVALNAVAELDRVDEIRRAMAPVRDSVRFLEGQRHDDYLPGDDQEAGIGLTGLIAPGAPPPESGPAPEAGAELPAVDPPDSDSDSDSDGDGDGDASAAALPLWGWAVGGLVVIGVGILVRPRIRASA